MPQRLVGRRALGRRRPSLWPGSEGRHVRRQTNSVRCGRRRFGARSAEIAHRVGRLAVGDVWVGSGPAPSCLVLDVFLPDLNGCDLQRLVGDRADMPIIFISGYGDVPMTVRAMKAGAVEFFTKPIVNDLLLSAIGNAITHSWAALEGAEQIRALRDSYASLSRREREVMALVVSGRLNKQVGAELGISEITVKA